MKKTINKKELKELVEIKRKLEEANFKDFDKIMYVPEVPLLGYPREYVIEEWYGIKVARLIGSSDD